MIDCHVLQDGKSITAAASALVLNLLLNGACAWCAHRYYKILIWDVETWPEVEATQQVQILLHFRCICNIDCTKA